MAVDEEGSQVSGEHGEHPSRPGTVSCRAGDKGLMWSWLPGPVQRPILVLIPLGSLVSQLWSPRATGVGESYASAFVIHPGTKGMMKPACNRQSPVGEQRHAVGVWRSFSSKEQPLTLGSLLVWSRSLKATLSFFLPLHCSDVLSWCVCVSVCMWFHLLFIFSSLVLSPRSLAALAYLASLLGTLSCLDRIRTARHPFWNETLYPKAVSFFHDFSSSKEKQLLLFRRLWPSSWRIHAEESFQICRKAVCPPYL